MDSFRGNWETGERRNFRRIMVVGGGRAGVATAEELRRQGFGGEIVVMCDERDAPYDRPSCSKGLLNGKKRPRDAKMPVQEDLAIQWLMGQRAVHLDPVNRVVFTYNDEKHSYDGLVIATGSRPIWPEDWPKGEPGLHQLHGLHHAWQLRQALYRAKRVAIVGGGLTGCEVACTVRSLARECVLIDSKQQVMSRALGEVVGRYVTEDVARDGVELRLGRRVKRLERARKGWVLVLDDASEVTADLVVATIGERPHTGWLEGSGYDISDGVLCDENLRVVGGEDVVAAGCVARWPNLRYSTKPKRVGQWIMALEQGRAAAAALLRSDSPTRPAALVPRYWSEQFGLRIQVCGEIPTDGSAEMTVSRQRPGRKDTARAGVLIGYHRNGEQIGVVGVNAMRAFTTTARMMLASPPKLIEPEPAYSGPLMLEAGPAAPPGPGEVRPVSGMVRPVSAAVRPVSGMVRPVSAAVRPVSGMVRPVSAAVRPVSGMVRPGPDGGRHSAGHPSGPMLEPAGMNPAPVSSAPRDRFVIDAPPYPARDYGPPPEPAYGYEQPGYGPPPAPGYDYGPPPEPAYGYGPPPPYEPAPGYPPGPGYEPAPGYAPAPGYEPAPGYAPGYEPAPGYAPARGYGPGPAYEPGPAYDYGPPPQPAYGYEQPAYPPPGPAPYEYGPPPGPGYGYEQPGYEQPVYPPEHYEQPAPVSPARPTSSVPRPRDRFATDQFAAVR